MTKKTVFAALLTATAIAGAADGLETKTWQTAIDAAAAAGGGRVTVPAGRHRVGGLELRSNVELHLEKGAVLEGVVGLENYRLVELPYSEGVWSAIVMGLNVTNVAITGEGEIFGNGKDWPQPETFGGNQEGRRARGVFLSECADVRLSDFLLRDVGCWGIVLKCCDGVVAKRVRVDNHVNANNDGFDIEAANALFEECDVDSSDDAFVLKSNNPHFAVTNVVVRDCIARSHCYALKLGTASHGVMSDIRFERVQVLPPKRDEYVNWAWKSRPIGQPFWSTRKTYWDFPAGSGSGGIAVECVDGGVVERVLFDGIDIYGYRTPIFIRGGTRKGRSCGIPPGDKYVLRDIVIRNVRGAAADTIASSISGVDGCRVSNVTLENVEIVCRGAGDEEARKAMSTPVPDVSGEYPSVSMFGHILPAYGLWVDRTDGVVLKNAHFRLLPGERDLRPATVLPRDRRSVTGDYRLPDRACVVSDVPGYNAWPMIQAVGDRLVCLYSRDWACPADGHTIHSGSRDAYARISSDGGLTWSQEWTVANDERFGEVNEGIGLDSKGRVLAWIRRWGVADDRRHELYRTEDGVSFERISSPLLDPFPVQVMDPVAVKGMGLVSLWFAGSYQKDGDNSWGILVSSDDGRTWSQRVIEAGLSVEEWVTEPSLVDLGGGRLLVVGRCERGLGNQFQVVSEDGGVSWRKFRTNVSDVKESTPSLVFDAQTGLVSLYYYQRGARLLKRRVASADFVFGHPQAWPDPEVLDQGYEKRVFDAGNVNVTRQGDRVCCAWYTGTPSNACVVVTSVPSPSLTANSAL